MPWRFEIQDWLDTEATGDIYHFGIWFGDSLINIANSLAYPENFRHIAFDSFEGLPLDPNEPLWHPEWHPETGYQNAYSAKTWAKTNDDEKVLNKVNDYIKSKTEATFQLVPGFYENSLTDDLVKELELEPAIYIDVDCDIYTSSVECLDFMARNKLIVPGTVIGFDDWKCTPDWEVCLTGESRAWLEIQKKYGIASHYVAQHQGLNDWVVEVDVV